MLSNKNVFAFQIGKRRYMSQLCHSNLQNGVKKITMVAPKTRNSLSLEMLTQLDTEIQEGKVKILEDNTTQKMEILFYQKSETKMKSP